MFLFAFLLVGVLFVFPSSQSRKVKGVGTDQYYSEVISYALFDKPGFYGSQNWNSQNPWVTLTPADRPELTTDCDSQLHSSPLGELNVEGAAARNHRFWFQFEMENQ